VPFKESFLVSNEDSNSTTAHSEETILSPNTEISCMSDSGEGVDPILQKGSTTWCRGVSQERKETFEEMTSIFCETNYTTLAQGFAAWGDSAEVDIESNISPISKTRESLECSLSHMCSSESYSFEKKLSD